MKRTTLLAALVVVVALLTGCGSPGEKAGASSEKAQKTYAPNIDPSNFVEEVDNKYFPLEPGTSSEKMALRPGPTP